MPDLTYNLTDHTYRTTLGTEADEVIIGNEKNPLAFEPTICFTKWSKECSLTLKLPPDLISNTTPTLDKQLTIGDSKTGFYFAPQEDVFKFGLILYEKPTTNTWSFQLEGWEEFDFLYQEPYSNVNEEDMSSWETTPWGTESHQEAGVAGSYAVYHKWKANYELGGTNYQNGKFCHIFRPKILDADGNKIGWADINIKDGIYILTVAQKILDTAKYPIRFNDDVGYKTIGGTYDYGDTSNTPIWCPIYGTPASNGTMTRYYHIGRSNPGDGVATFAFYDDSSGKPVNRLQLDSGTTAFPIDDPPIPIANKDVCSVTVTASTQYWIAFHIVML